MFIVHVGFWAMDRPLVGQSTLVGLRQCYKNKSGVNTSVHLPYLPLIEGGDLLPSFFSSLAYGARLDELQSEARAEVSHR